MNIEELPKVDLHYHLDGSVNPSTLIEIALQENIELPTMKAHELWELIKIGEECKKLTEYLNKFELPKKCMQSSKALEEVAYRAIEDVSKQNVMYIEIRFAPHLHTKKGLSLKEVVSHVLNGLRKGEKAYGITARAILVCMRHDSIKKNMEVIEVANTFLGKGVVGVDLAGDEANYPPYLFKPVYDLASKYQIPITIHAGEAAGSQSIHDAVVHLHARRIGHGVRLKEDPQLIDFIKDKNITLELCPTSNIQTKAIESWNVYPLRQYFDKGISVTINTDNTTVSNTNISKEYKILVEKYDFNFKEMKKLILNSLQAAFVNNEKKQELIKSVEEYFKRIIKE